ncbi:MAG TPA: tRNA (guanosine(37)-N1)-methyltransferase TrmD [Candidatus Saccharimonadales bacterium]|nr:tRNA (guanosine(37)-N1)-methyltransferase TrmD [Candidatus Saccharimonadales bacterium]
MKISILTLFPEMFVGPFDHSIIKHAQQKNLVEITYVNIRDYGLGKHKVVDDKPYGGGVGMLLKVDVLDQAIEAVKDKTLQPEEQKVILLSAGGKTFNQQKAQEFSKIKHIIFVCGHYEGFDERIKSFIDEEISIGDFITTGGEIPTMLITDAIVRLIPGVLKNEATSHESFSLKDAESTLLEFPQYTTPAEYKNMKVPEVLTSGNHKAIETWRKEQAKTITKKHRPDLLK